MKRYILVLMLAFAVASFDSYGQRRSKNGIARQKRGGGDPFSGGGKKKFKIKFDNGPSFGGKYLRARSKKKIYSLRSNQNRNARLSRQNYASKGIKRQYNVSHDSFSKKNKKGFRSSGKRGEEFYKKKHKKLFKFGSHRGREGRRMEKANKKSFRK